MSNRRWKKWTKPKLIPQEGKSMVITEWGWAVSHPKNLILEKFTDVGFGTYINAKHGVELQERVQLGSHCAVYSISTIDDKKGRVVIKKNARVGSHSVVMPGITIGANSVVGAFSLVNSDIPDNVVAFGIPARVVRKLERKE